jgi:hypothetical protein
MHKCINNSIANVYHLEQFVSDFFPYSQKQLGFDQPATIRFESDRDNADVLLGKTAYYDPANYEVVLYVDGRHPKDIMRSLSHELVHHAQNCRGDFTGQNSTGPGYAQKDAHLRKMEQEAYTKGNLIFRDFEDLIKTGKINIEIDFSDSGEPKMSLKEWKNNELNTLLMKKWGLLKEGKVPRGDAGHGGSEDDHYQFDKKEREAELQEDSEGEETYHYGEDEGRDDHELRDLIKRHARKSHIDALKRDMHYDEDHEDRRERGDHFREGHEHGPECGCPDMEDSEIVEGGMSYRDEDEEDIGSKEHNDEEGNRDPSDDAILGLKKENRSGKISVKEAKEITRRIIARVRKEGK